MKKRIIAAAVAAVFSASVYAQNLGFEDGNTTGWNSTTLSAVGSTTTQAGQNTWVINPYGSYMGKLQIQSGSYSSMASALGLTSSSTTAIQTLLNQQAQVSGGNPNPTTAGWVTKTVTLTAGTTFTLAWQYVSVDYVPFNDGSIATLTQNGTNTATVNNYNQQYALLGFTNPGTGDYSTGSYGATGWQVATFQVSVDGTYTLGFGVFNMGDTALSPILFIDEVQGTTTLNGQTFGAVAPNNSTAPSSPVSGGGSGSGGGGGGSTPSPTATVNSGSTAGTDTLASSVTVNGGTIQVAATGITLTNTFTVDSNGMTIDQNGNTVDFSGVISGSGGVTISNTSTGGGVTFSAVNTYTGTTTINSGAGLENTGTIAGPVSNQGTFLNNGTAGNVVNGADGTNTSAVAINNGTVGTVTNYGLFTNAGTTSTVSNFGTFGNSGTTGNVTNFGTFNNTGNVGTFNNAGVLNNMVGGVVNELGYNNFWVQNSGTINSITYNGGTVINNANGTIGTINTTQAHGTFNNEGTVTGTVTTNGTFNNYGTVVGLFTNSGTLTNTGTLGDVSNTGTVTNSGSVGAVNNSGTFTSTGNVGSINNSGTLDVTGGISLFGSYTQTPSGTTYMTSGYPFGVTGNASLAGGLFINDIPTAYGRYTVLTAGSIDGRYQTLGTNGILGNDYLKYSNTDVKLYVTPPAQATQSSINTVASNVSSMNNLQTGVINNSLGNDCNLFGDNEACMSVNFANTAASTGDLASGGVTLAKRINDNWKAGVIVDSPFNSPTIGSVKQVNNPAVGGFIGWNEFDDGTGLGIQLSAISNTGKMTVTRTGPETGTGTAKTNGSAYQLKATYSHPFNSDTMMTDYIGIRQTKLNIGGYTETGPVFPLTVNGTQQTTTDLIAGIGLSHKVTSDLTATGSVGVVQNLSKNGGSFSGVSEIGNLQTFNTALPASSYTSVALGGGLSYAVAKDQRIGVAVGWQQKGLVNSSITSYGLNYTVGF